MKYPATRVEFSIDDAALQRLYDTACRKCENNLQMFGTHQVLVEGGGYEKIWLETQPMGGEMYAKRNMTAAMNNQLLFIRHQREDGRLAGSIQALADGRVEPQFNKFQGFCFPWPALNMYYWAGEDRAYLDEVATALEKFDAYLWRTRDTDRDGCLESFCVYDTGEDNAVRYGDASNYCTTDTPPAGSRVVPMASMDVTSFSYAARDTLAAISRIRGDGQEKRWRTGADAVAAALRSRLWSHERGACFDRDCSGRTMPILTHNSLRCMYWGSFSQHMADRFVQEHLLNPAEFWTALPLPSVAVNDPAFRNAPGTDYMLLDYHSKQEDATFPVYPVNDQGLYQGQVSAPLTYARTLLTVQVRNGKGSLKKEDTVRKGYEAPVAAESKEGRLSGVVVCIDPGHQENGQYVTEPNGPGLKGSTRTKGGMAQGTVTLRRESIVVLETGMILRDLLLQEGATVVMTRQRQDEYHTNIERTEIAAEAGAHIMLRLHCDNNANASKSGISVFAPRNSDYAKAVAAPEEYQALGEAFLNEMKKSVGYELTNKTGRVQLNDNYVGNNWAKMVCFLVEMGYMSNPAEDVKLADEEYQTMLAQGMVEGVYQVALMRGWITE